MSQNVNILLFIILFIIIHVKCVDKCDHIVNLAHKKIFNKDDRFSQNVIKRSIYLGYNKTNILSDDKIIKILTIGGSMTCGSDLKYPKSETWSARLKQVLESLPREYKVNVHTLCGSGQGLQYFYNDPKFWNILNHHKPDLLIPEFVINDTPGIMSPDFIAKYPIFFTDFIKKVKIVSPNTKLFYLVLFKLTEDIQYQKQTFSECPDLNPVTSHLSHTSYSNETVHYCTHWWSTATIQQNVLHDFDIPYFSYRDMVWPFLHMMPDNIYDFWHGSSHPDTNTHLLIAKELLLALSIQCEDSLNKTPSFHLLPSIESKELTNEEHDLFLDRNQCLNPISIFEKDNFIASKSDKEWKYGVNINDESRHPIHPKLGWMNFKKENKQPSIIEFNIHIGIKGLILMEYLRTNFYVGVVSVYIGEVELGKMITNWESFYTLPEWYSIHIPNDILAGIKNRNVTLILKYEVQPRDHYYFRHDPGFFLFSLISC
jgi:hypothetical protein